MAGLPHQQAEDRQLATIRGDRGTRYMGADRAEEFGKRNGVPR